MAPLKHYNKKRKVRSSKKKGYVGFFNYGNWCGSGWSGGAAQNSVLYGPAPVDAADMSCRKHDQAYYSGKRLKDADMAFAKANIGYHPGAGVSMNVMRNAMGIAVGLQGLTRTQEIASGKGLGVKTSLKPPVDPSPAHPERFYGDGNNANVIDAVEQDMMREDFYANELEAGNGLFVMILSSSEKQSLILLLQTVRCHLRLPSPDVVVVIESLNAAVLCLKRALAERWLNE